MTRALVVAAPQTGSGKTTLTLALLRAYRRRGLRAASAKVGPDFIDPRFHEAASGESESRPCVNLDGWAMRRTLLDGLFAELMRADLVLIEGVMGLFDGALEPGVLGRGATADLAKHFGTPVLLVVNAAGLGASAAALVHGFSTFDPDIRLAGLVLNQVGSERHAAILTEALAPLGLPVFGLLPRRPDLARPSRHLGLVQAEEADDLEAFLERAADAVEAHLDLDALLDAAAHRDAGRVAVAGRTEKAWDVAVPPLGQRIAVADDLAFRFAYPHVLRGWRAAGAELLRFSPLADEAPDEAAHAVYLPGGYPELHAGRLAANARFLDGLRRAAARGACVYGECGGYMVLGETLVDAEGQGHRMAGLLATETSFAERGLHLGYRHVIACDGSPWPGTRFRAHEFHYSKPLREADASLFANAGGARRGRVMGSYLHLIDQAAAAPGSRFGPSAEPIEPASARRSRKASHDAARSSAS
jgi:cobyrinic acid a,c-diamide synthase